MNWYCKMQSETGTRGESEPSCRRTIPTNASWGSQEIESGQCWPESQNLCSFLPGMGSRRKRENRAWGRGNQPCSSSFYVHFIMWIPTTRPPHTFISFIDHFWSHDRLNPVLDVGEIKTSRLALSPVSELTAEGKRQILATAPVP